MWGQSPPWRFVVVGSVTEFENCFCLNAELLTDLRRKSYAVSAALFVQQSFEVDALVVLFCVVRSANSFRVFSVSPLIKGPQQSWERQGESFDDGGWWRLDSRDISHHFHPLLSLLFCPRLAPLDFVVGSRGLLLSTSTLMFLGIRIKRFSAYLYVGFFSSSFRRSWRTSGTKGNRCLTLAGILARPCGVLAFRTPGGLARSSSQGTWSLVWGWRLTDTNDLWSFQK